MWAEMVNDSFNHKIRGKWSSNPEVWQSKRMEVVYHSVLGKRPILGKRPCTAFQGVTIATSIQTYGILIPSRHPYEPKSRVMFKRPWALTQDTMVLLHCAGAGP